MLSGLGKDLSLMQHMHYALVSEQLLLQGIPVSLANAECAKFHWTI